ncbi:MAG: VWA domain-containing protein [Planctomycetia bacterium]|nr:VWA domain-containing protein [Planctomycetia bacterium]
MSYAPPRRVVRKKRDNTPLIIAIIAILALPALGFGVYQVLNKPKDTNGGPAVAYIPPAQLKRDRLPAAGSQTSEAEYASSKSSILSNPMATNYSNTGSNFGGSSNAFSGSMSSGSGMQSANAATAKACKKIQESLELRKGLVVWLFDRSPSADGRREEVMQAIKSLYPTIVPEGDRKAATSKEDAKLLTAVGAFASDAQFFTDDPVAGDEKVLAAIEGIKSGSDGNIENTFRAISAAITKYAVYTEPPHLRSVSIVVVTDEVGNDQAQRDLVMEAAQKHTIPIYVIGSGAEFGSVGATDVGPEGSAVIRGPESRDVEWVKLDTGSGPGMMGSQECGIGPYGLSAICRESGGEYFVVSSLGGGVTLPPQYYPRYMPERDYQAYVSGNKAMQALIAASKLPAAKQISGAETSFTTDETGVAKTLDIDKAQRPQALIKPALDELFDTLKKGESDRAKLTEPRQQAAFDLALGRAMAAKVRTEGYIVLLAAFKAGRKASKPGAVLWRLEPADGIEKNSVLDSMSKKAREYLEGVVKNHPNTPWAEAAKQELNSPIGWKWTES